MRNGLFGLMSALLLASTMAAAGCTSSVAATGSGGSTGSGGATSSGGSSSSGGAVSSGGSSSSGGTAGTGGTAGRGGTVGSGGSSTGGGAGGGSSVTTLSGSKPLGTLTPTEATQLCDDTYTYFGQAIRQADPVQVDRADLRRVEQRPLGCEAAGELQGPGKLLPRGRPRQPQLRGHPRDLYGHGVAVLGLHHRQGRGLERRGEPSGRLRHGQDVGPGGRLGFRDRQSARELHGGYRRVPECRHSDPARGFERFGWLRRRRRHRGSRWRGRRDRRERRHRTNRWRGRRDCRERRRHAHRRCRRLCWRQWRHRAHRRRGRRHRGNGRDRRHHQRQRRHRGDRRDGRLHQHEHASR